MKIERIEIYRVAMPLKEPFRYAGGVDFANGGLVVKMVSSDGVYGWGESTPGQYPGYCPEWDGCQFLVAREFIAPRLIGQDIQTGEQLQELLKIHKGNNFAKAAFDLAWWDLYARSQSKPLWKVIGGRSDTVHVGTGSGVLDSIDELLKRIEQAINDGYSRMKLKYMPGWEIEVVDAVRKAYPDLTLHIDCNSAYTLDDLEMFRKLDKYNLAMIEQPLANDDLLDHAELQKRISTPICLDESITSPDKARKAVRIGACKWINIKLGRVGGLTNAIAIHNIAEDAGVGCWVGGMIESALGLAHNIALATMPNIKYPSDIPTSSHHYDENLSAPEIVLSGPSQMKAFDTPGVGVEPILERLEKMTVEKKIFNA